MLNFIILSIFLSYNLKNILFGRNGNPLNKKLTSFGICAFLKSTGQQSLNSLQAKKGFKSIPTTLADFINM